MASGDGYRYRGRGFIMVTFKSNYAAVGRDSAQDLVAHPELLGQPVSAAIASMAYWRIRDINLAADSGNTEAVTVRINSAKVALDDRIAWYKAASQIWAKGAPAG